MLADGPRSLEVRADLSGKAEHELVRRGALRGFSIEFRSKKQRYEGGTRIIESAELTGLALVDEPAYPESVAEARACSGRTLSQRIPSNRKLSCECSEVQCKWARFVGDALQEAVQESYDEAAEILATYGSYENALASKSKGTLRMRALDDGDAEVEIDVPVGPEGEALVRAHENAGIVARPYLDRDLSEGVVEPGDAGGVMAYSKARIRGVIVSATDARAGWPTPTFIATPGMDADRAAPAPRKRVAWWLL